MSVAVLEELKAIGVEVVPSGDNLVIRPASKVPRKLKERIRAEKAQILAELRACAPPPTPADSKECRIEFPSRRCRACNGWLFWVSRRDVVVCSTCHPPANPGLVRRWYWLPDGEGKKIQ